MGKRIPQLDSGTPDTSSLMPFYDPATDTTKYTTTPKLGALGFLYRALSANAAGTDVATAQPWFPATGAVAVEANTLYEFEGILRTSRSAGTTSHTTSLLFGGTATLTSILYRAYTNTGDTVANGTCNVAAIEVATAVAVKGASTSATEQISIRVRGVVRVNAAGTLIPQFQYSSAPGGAPSVLANSFFRLLKLGAGTDTTQGTWS